MTQAILPLRGKILNVEKCSSDKIYQNNELQSLISALGLGVKNAKFDESALRYPSPYNDSNSCIYIYICDCCGECLIYIYTK